jgi:hypothetical protein
VGILDREAVVGYLGSIPTAFWDGRSERDGYWIKGFMVLEAYRNGPLGYLLARQMRDVTGLSGVMVVAPPARRLFEALGYRDMGAVANLLTPVNPVGLLRSADPRRLNIASLPKALMLILGLLRWAPFAWLGGTVMRVALALLDGFNHLRYARMRAVASSVPPGAQEIDALWLRMRRRLDFAANRGGAYVHWRYATGDRQRYEFLVVREGSRLAALAVVRQPQRLDDPRLAGLRIGLVVDFIADPVDTHAVAKGLLAVRRWGRAGKCDAVLFTVPHRDISDIARRLGFAKIPGNVHFMLRTPPGTAMAPATLDGSWVTRGDAWGDDI